MQTVDSRVASWVASVLVNAASSLNPMTTQEGAREILAHLEAIYTPTHDYVAVSESGFAHLDLSFYRRTREELEAGGFVFLEDCEDRTLADAPGNVLMPVMLRVLVSRDGTVSAGLYHARLKRLWLRLLTALIGKRLAPVIDFETEFDDGSFICTSNASAAAAITSPPLIDSEYHRPSTPCAELLQRHRQRVELKKASSSSTPRQLTSITALRASQNRMNAIKAAYRGEVGGVTREELEKLSSFAGRAIAGEVHAEIQKIHNERLEAVPAAVVSSAADRENDALLAQLVARGESTPTKSSGNALLLLTTLLFVGGGAMSWGWETVVYVAVAVALHELGHVLAMRCFGYKNVRMLFIPFFGGLATGQPQELDATKNALVAIAGPAFGLVTVMVAGLAALILGSPPWLVQFAWVSLFLNAFNLLPLMPLDGGQFTNDTLFSRFPVLELVFRLMAIAALGWLAFHWVAWLLGGMALFMLISTPASYRRAVLIRDARRQEIWRTRPLDRDTAGALREIVRKLFASLPPEKYAGKTAEHAHGVWLEIRKQFPGPAKTLGLLAGYAVLVVFFLLTGFLMAGFLAAPAAAT